MSVIEKSHSSQALNRDRLMIAAGFKYLRAELKNDALLKPDSTSYYPTLGPYV